MKKGLLFFYITLITIILSFLSSCKKGENDPAFSILSRKARLVGEWKLSSANWTRTRGNFVMTYIYDGVYLSFDESYLREDTYEYSENFDFNYDGTFTYKIIQKYMNSPLYLETKFYEGYWTFLKGIKEIDLKDKERVNLLILKYTQQNISDQDTLETIFEYSGNSNSNNMELSIDRLANSEMIILIDSKETVGNWEIIESGTKTYKNINK